MNIEIIKSKIGWDNFLNEVEEYDFYHTYDYHQISKSDSDSVVLIKYTCEDIIIGLPLLIRKIEGTDYYDAISVYGYSGPISNGVSGNFDSYHYKKCMTKFFIKEKIVSVFTRLNPHLPYQNIIFHNFGELKYLGRTVNINLTISLEEQKRKYHRRLKNHVNKADRECTVKKAITKEDFQIFKDLYIKSMNRVEAKSFYFFSDEYFEKLNSSKDFKIEILLAFDNETGKPIAGCLFVKTNKMVQYHLSGACSEYLHLNATKLLIDKMRLEATNEGYKNFNLGGGLGANENDTLFRFKSSFSNEYHHFFIWKLIVNKSKYNELCTKNNISNHASIFFPLYRLQEYDLKKI